MLLWLADPSLASSQYRFDVWTADDGLPQNIVRGIRQSADGYLWLATLDGLARFDGVRFTTFNKSNTPGIASNRFRMMVQTTDGDLWLLVESGGLTRYHNGQFSTYGSERGIPGGLVEGINADHSGHLWILANKRILIWHEELGRFLDVTPQPSLDYAPSIWTNGGFWAVLDSTLYIFHEGKVTQYPLPPTLRHARLWGAGVDPDKSVILETIDGKQSRVYRDGVPHPAREPTVQSTRWVDRSGHLWVMPLGRQLKRSLEDIGGVPGGRIPFSCFFEDRQGNLWLGTEGQGLYRFKRQVIKTYSTAQGLGSALIYPVYEDSRHDIWAGTWGAGISRLRDGKVSRFSMLHDGRNASVTSLLEDRDHTLWAGSYAGLYVLRNGRFVVADGPDLPRGAVVQAMAQGRDGTLWLGTTGGLAAYRDGKTVFYGRRDGLATEDVRTLMWGGTPETADDLWIGGYGGVSLLHQGSFHHWSEADGLPSNTVRALYPDNEGALWIGTYDGGLGRFKAGRFSRYTTKDGLFNYGVFAIVEDDQRNLWMSSNRGIYRVAKAQLNEFADGRRSSITSVAYGKGDGMLNVECNGGVWPAGIKAADGKLWFPTQDGLAEVDPNAIAAEDPQPPPVVIEDVRLDQRPVSIVTPLRLLPSQDNLEIEYTSPSFIKSDQIRFKYRMEGLDSSWVDVGSRRTAYFSHLTPGSYTFHVIAGNGDGVWNLVGKTLEISVLPPFYKTWWFAFFILLAVALLIAAAWKYRVAQFKELQEVQTTFSRRLISSQEMERKRIAGELHDGLGQRLVVINQLALLGLRAEANTKRSSTWNDSSGEMRVVADNPLAEISTEAAQAIQEIRQISHGLRPFLLDRVGLTKAIESILRTVSAAASIRIESSIDNIDDFFPEELRINLFRVFQEAMNNIMKHAGATEVRVTVTRTASRLLVEIGDNGRGFAEQNRAPETQGDGLGMQGMMERVRLLGGTMEVSSIPGRTLLKLAIREHRFDGLPAARAMDDQRKKQGEPREA